MKIASCLTILSATASLAAAFVNPVDPWGSTLWKPNTNVNISWTDDGTAPKLTTDPVVDIYLNTGGDQSNIKLATIATGVDAGKTSSVSYLVPNVSPPGKIYFLTFVSSTGVTAWSTRFTITDADGNAGTLAPSAPVGSNSGAVGSIVSTSVIIAPTTSGAAGATATGTITASAGSTATGAATATATAAGRTSGASSFGVSGLSAAAVAVAALFAF
ncbi:hypothetical protein BGZ49_006292 [Haplosporangium sp. Z 27]|nr:hypothetical protein BGZ49_006292 [Haplosporangium sp. Z 27]